MSKDGVFESGEREIHPSRHEVDTGRIEQNRRAFLRFLSIGAGSAVVGGAFGYGRSATAAPNGAGQAATVTKASSLVDDHDFWDNLKRSFIRPEAGVVFDVDGGRVAPEIALNALNRPRGNGDVKKGVQADEPFTVLTSQRQIVGPLLGAQVDDTALINGATTGITHALTGLRWSQDDVIFYTDHEHPNVIALINSLAHFYKIIAIKIVLPTSPNVTAEEMAATFEKMVSRHRPAKRKLCALVWSSPTYQTGVMLPIARLTAIARKFGVISICDGAHLMGMASVDFSRLELDFLATSGHKWQCGPSMTGVLLRDPRMVNMWNPPAARQMPGSTGRTTSFGDELSVTPVASSGKFDSLAASCTLWQDIGVSKIEAYSLSLAAYLKAQIQQAWGTKALRSPVADPELLSAITSFDPFFDSPLALQPKAYADFAEQLESQHGFKVRVFKVPSGQATRTAIRISTPLWVNSQDIHQLISAMQSVKGKIKAS